MGTWEDVHEFSDVVLYLGGVDEGGTDQGGVHKRDQVI
jgi:hypothetical protein